MISGISVKNYKAFDEVDLELRPITVLLGANNIGKTSLLQIFLLLQNTSTVDSQNYRSALKLHGLFTSAGEKINVFRNRDKGKKLIISFDLEENDFFQNVTDSLRRKTYSLLERLYQNYYRDMSLIDKKRRTDLPVLMFNFPESFQNRSSYLNAIRDLERSWKQVRDVKKNKERISSYETFLGKDLADTMHIANAAEYSQIFDIIEYLDHHKVKCPRIEYSIRLVEFEKTTSLHVSRLSMYLGGKVLFQIDIENGTFTSETFPNILGTSGSKAWDQVSPWIALESTIFGLIKPENKDRSRSPLVDSVLFIISRSIEELRKSFSNESICHVSPLRAIPRRYYYVERAKNYAYIDTADGDSIADVLKNNRSDVLTKLNKWLDRFGLSVKAETMKETINQLIITNQKSALSLDLTDVGFGLSQIIPILIQGFLAIDDSLTIVEQPEIHLHPTMQAEMADFFIENALDSKLKRKYLIETHSEYFLHRLRRRIAEGRIKSEDVAIYFIDRDLDESRSILERIQISDTGIFRWPKNFSTLIEDTNAFVEAQGRKNES